VSNFHTTLGPPGGQVTEGTLVPVPEKEGIKRRNQGASYVSDKRGKNVAGRELGPIWKFKK
jgi:hypothetical protein